MKHARLKFAQRYEAALRAYLNRDHGAALPSAHATSAEMVTLGLGMPELISLHERILAAEMLPVVSAPKRLALVKRASIFFAAAAVPLDRRPASARPTAGCLRPLVRTLAERTAVLAGANAAQRLEIDRRKTLEKALRADARRYEHLMKHSARQHEEARRLSRQVLSAQEDERKRISRELHDVIAQTLTGISLRLATLKKEAMLNARGLDQNIARTQRLVEKSVSIVQQFARDLRPAVLDDLGLIPALHSFLKDFAARTGLRPRLTTFTGVEQLDLVRRTVLFRVAQEALTNVARHAEASRVEVSLQKRPDSIRLRVKDDGKSFQINRVLQRKRGRRLGLLAAKPSPCQGPVFQSHRP